MSTINYSYSFQTPTLNKRSIGDAINNIQNIRKMTNTSINYDNICQSWTLKSMDANSLGIALSMVLNYLVNQGQECALNVPTFGLFQKIPDVVTTFTSTYLEEMKAKYPMVSFEYVPATYSWVLKSNSVNHLAFAVGGILLAMENKIGYNVILEPMLAKDKIGLALYRLSKMRIDRKNNKQTDDKLTDDKQTDDKQTDDKQTDDKQTDDKQTDELDKQTDELDKQTDELDKQTDELDKQTDELDKQTDDKQTDDKQTDDKQTDDKQTDDKQNNKFHSMYIPKGTNIFYDNNLDLWCIHSLTKKDLDISERILTRVENWCSNHQVKQTVSEDVSVEINLEESQYLEKPKQTQQIDKTKYFPNKEEQQWLDTQIN